LRTQTLEATYGALLHDMGKIIHRAGSFDGRSHSISGHDFLKDFNPTKNILDCVRYHHKSELRQATLSKDSPAYIVYLADNVASAADRRTKDRPPEGEQPYRRDQPLTSLFNLLNGNNGNLTLPAKQLDGNLPIPKADINSEYHSGWYSHIVQELKDGLKGILFEHPYLDSLLTLLETHISFIPSSTASAEEADISLFDHSKIAAAVSSCYSEYFLANQISNLKKATFDEEKMIMQEKTFLLFSADLSGIQKFIYNIVSDDALKSLRSRSFFLEILMEHIMDELLDGCGLSRVNLIFQGGGHCYVLLPHTEEVLSFLSQFEKKMNDWMIHNFATGIYIAMAWVACSGNDLINEPAQEAPYKRTFAEVNEKIALKKSNRYSAEQIHTLNQANVFGERECKICGITENLNSNGFCEWCDHFRTISNSILKDNLIMITTTKPISRKEGLTLPSFNYEKVHLYFLQENDARSQLADSTQVLRVYSKNNPFTGVSYSTRVFVGDYNSSPLLDQMAKSHEGIQRISVFRGDVDNLGYTMLAGYERQSQNVEERYRFVTLSRIAGLSRQLSLFFKYYVNQILAHPSKNHLTNTPISKRDVMIVYSGGDDIFLIGQWQDTLEAALDIQESFFAFTGGALTLSGGLGIFDVKHPVAVSSLEVASMEKTSKNQPEKNSLTLFKSSTEHTYGWEPFQSKVLSEKVTLLQTFFAKDQDSTRGNAFLYGLLDLLREANQTINIARCAYKLTRLAPKENAPYQIKEQYKQFSQNIMKWIRTPEERRQFITAATIYVYLQRRKVQA